MSNKKFDKSNVKSPIKSTSMKEKSTYVKDLKLQVRIKEACGHFIGISA